MTPLTAILILVGMFGGLGIFTTYVLVWMKKNSIFIQISELKDGVLLSGGGRYRISNVKVYSKSKIWWKPDTYQYTWPCYFHMMDYFKRNPLPIMPDMMNDYMMTAEAMPVIGIKKILKIKKVDDHYLPWKPCNVENKHMVESTILSWSNSTREELYESTKSELTQAEQLNRILLPVGLIILGISCLIFFPKVYASIMHEGNAVAKAAIDQFGGIVDRFIPLG